MPEGNILLFKEKKTKVWIEPPLVKNMSAQIETDYNFDSEPLQQQLPHYYRCILSDFRKNSRAFAIFNAIFICIATLQIGLFFTLLPLMREPTTLAIILSTFFLTLFSYLILLFYYQAKKPEQLEELIQKFRASCQSSFKLFPETASHHLSVAQALVKLSHHLTDYEHKLVDLPDRFTFLTRFASRCNANLSSQGVFYFKQALLRTAITEHLMQIRFTPTDLELHASLANTYVALAHIYNTPNDAWQPLNFYKKNGPLFLEKFKTYSQLAMEEFQILNEYAPNDPWIHEQLANGYRTLSLPLEEISEVEFLLKLRPNDRDVSFRLGTLYFEQGLNAKGLQIYEELKKEGFPKAELLIATYTKFS